ncbi:hypothetical protein K8I61_20485 [bacterium]|nr:hypothetical protein [bacterium]
MKSSRFVFVFLVVFAFAFAAGCSCGDDDDDDSSSGDDDADDDTQGDDDADDDFDMDDDFDDDANDDDADDDAGCEEPAPSTNEHTLLGITYLEAGAAGLAHAEFVQALADDSSDADAAYGLVLAGFLMEASTIDVIVTYINSFMGFHEPPTKAASDSLQSVIDAVLDAAFDGLVLQFTEDVFQLGPQLQEAECLSFELAEMPIIFDFETVVSPGGDDWDQSEIAAVMGFTGGFGGLIRLITVLDFDLDLSYIFGLAEINWGSYDVGEIISIVVDILYEILNDPAFPDFLTRDTDGQAAFELSQIELGLGFRNAGDTFDIVRSETDDQAGDIIRYIDVNGNFVFDAFDHFDIPFFGELDEAGMGSALAFEVMFKGLADSLLDRTGDDTQPGVDTPFPLAYVNGVLSSLGMPAILPNVTIDLAGWFEDSTPTGFRDDLRGFVNLLHALLPPPPPY